ncbi:ROK family transcriptional regulator [Demequina sp. SYSU T00039]|uniref:ROK family transcriptional regulator n=1 Tax=Demequina lignilytica TaxID=3051663 RepID=A0AAW7M9C3_9MICO|nr:MULTISPECIES: ROK family transcriptional regulator [unclassified Demequina]MDN4477927.1 ROK family transcriptional regulator [Demequina sp. SYSU T00039-1]MDN4487836.1 ROK family transcriptional regulator [Demequina sp. SYSU T00039]MDN4490781.1 ROK family transcriptional regulator [Demequina sp. SYSU T00068]
MPDTTTSSDLLAVLRDGRSRTKTELAEATDRSRSTVTAHLAKLVEGGIVTQLERTAATKGRPSMLYALAADAGVIVAVELGARHALVALTDLAGGVTAHHRIVVDVVDGPEPVLAAILTEARDLLAAAGRPESDVAGFGIGIPAPVELATGLPVSPPLMPGWDRFDIRAYVRLVFDVPVMVDNDVNVMAVGEGITHWVAEREMLMIKVATGIGAGVVVNQRLVHGADGAAGEIGHIRVSAAGDRVCRCGQTGCLESFASGIGIARTLAEQGVDTDDGRDVVALVRAGSIEATRAVREAGRAIGEALATCISLINPSVIVIGGSIASVGEPLLAGIREVVYQRSQPLASKQLRVVAATDLELAGVTGVSRLVQSQVFHLAGLGARPTPATQRRS